MYLQLAVQAQVHPSKQNDVAINPLTECTIISLPLILLWRLSTPEKTS
ncbi:hypothetical protein FIS3754_17580 [Fischerella sp. NIES-3754]|nr:hypothetical protein FIS3754_17580 [Fischerella sp. NIES-3754]BCX08126.1 MAG: hypothetical protein KatS3mg066_1985 [Fischerella sp.]